MTAIGTIIRNATRKEDEPYNVLTLLDEDIGYIMKLAELNCNVYCWSSVNGVDWPKGTEKPENIYIVKSETWPNRITLDLAICTNRGFFQFFRNACNNFHMPLVLLEHQVPTQEYMNVNVQEWRTLQSFEGDINVFSSEASRESWDKLGYVVETDNDSFSESWNNILQEACSLIYTRM